MMQFQEYSEERFVPQDCGDDRLLHWQDYSKLLDQSSLSELDASQGASSEMMADSCGSTRFVPFDQSELAGLDFNSIFHDSGIEFDENAWFSEILGQNHYRDIVGAEPTIESNESDGVGSSPSTAGGESSTSTSTVPFSSSLKLDLSHTSSDPTIAFEEYSLSEELELLESSLGVQIDNHYEPILPNERTFMSRVNTSLPVTASSCGSVVSVSQLLAWSRILNDKLKFSNVSSHAWIPVAPSTKQDIYRFVCYRPHETKDPSLYVAVLHGNMSREVVQKKISELQTTTYVDIALESKKPKKRKNMLKDWDPMEVYYPLGYIPFTHWLGINELESSKLYVFDVNEFRSGPAPNSGATLERYDDVDMVHNKYDSFYLRSDPVSGERECYCGCCATWHKRDQCNWLHHMKSQHGIRSCTKQRYSLPHIVAERPSNKKTNTGLLIGYCDTCQSWQNVNNSPSPNNYSSWFLHQAYHDVERNKLEGRTGKKRSKAEISELQRTTRIQELREINRTKLEIQRVMADEIFLNRNRHQFATPFFQNEANYKLKDDIF
jgi:hypothetical protein